MNLQAHRTRKAYSPKCVEGKFCELRVVGVMRSSLRASNAKHRQRYAVWGMCQNAQPCYRAAQQRLEARNRPQSEVGHPWVRGASGATGYRTEIPYKERWGRKELGVVGERFSAPT